MCSDSVVLLATVCGSTTTRSGTPTTPAGVRTIVRAAVVNVRAPSVAARRAVVPVPEFDPEHPDPSQLPAVVNYLRAAADGRKSRQPCTSRPRRHRRSGWHQLFGIADQVTTSARQQIAAARAKDVATFVHTFHTASQLVARLNTIASRFGFNANSA